MPLGPSKPDEPDVPDDPDDPVEPADAKPSPSIVPPARWELEAKVDDAVVDDCFEASMLRLRAKLVEGKALTPKATFTVLRDGAAVASGEVSTAGDVTFQWEIARVGDDEVAWTLENRRAPPDAFARRRSCGSTRPRFMRRGGPRPTRPSSST